MFHTIQKGSLEYLTADALEGSVHCFTTRYGGVSTGQFSTLNLGTSRGDSMENVLRNYEILGAAVGFPTRGCRPHVAGAHGYHPARGKIRLRQGLVPQPAGRLRWPHYERTRCGASCAFAADCTPVLLFDPVKNVAAAVHAGWRGTANGIARKAVEKMAREFGSNPADIGAAIGPCISQCCFETDIDVPQAMLRAFGDEANAFIEKRGEKYFVDNKGLNKLWLTRAGVTKIDVSQACTMCQPERFWSHRVTKGYRGSHTGIIELKEAAQ